MTSIGAAANSLLNYTSAGTVYSRSAAVSDPLVAAATASSSDTATNVTLSDAALAALAGQGTSGGQDDATAKTFAAVTAEARATLDQLLAAAKVTSPLSNGKPTIDLSKLDDRSLYAIASNSQGLFSSDEQTVASQEMQSRFDRAMSPKLAASDLTGNYSDVYKAAMDYLDAMSPEQQATTAWAQMRTALTQGYNVTKQNPSALPSGIANDPIADLVTRSSQNPSVSDPADFAGVANSARASLDQQALDAKRKGTQLVLDPKRSTGQQVDWSGFDNQSLSAIVLNQGSQFSPQEVRAGKNELDLRNRTSILKAFQQSQSSADPRALSYSLLSQYSGMTAEQRQASNWTTGFRDTAVQNYKSASNLLSMMSQASGGSSSDSSDSLSFLSTLGS